MSNNTKKRLIIILIAIQFLAEIVCAIFIAKADVLPIKYFIILVTLFIMLLAVSILIGFPYIKDKTEYKKGVLIFGILYSIIITCICIVGTFVVAIFSDTMSAVTTPKDVGNVMGVYVLEKDKAKKIEDTIGYTYGISSSFDGTNQTKMINHIEKELKTKINKVQCSNAFDLAEKLKSKKVQAIILNEAYIDILEESSKLDSFDKWARLIYEYKISDKNNKKKSKINSEITSKPFAIYLSGLDTRNKMLSVSRSDVNIIAIVNPVNKKILLINTPRDYYIPNPAGNGELDKLTHCGIYGIDCSMQALSDLYDIDIEYYAQINFKGMEKLVDALDGVDVYSDNAFSTEKYSYSIGYNYMDGKKALAFARDRYHQKDGDNSRGVHQMAVINAIVNKATSTTKFLTNYSSIMKSLEGMFTTNISSKEISQLVKMQLNDMSYWKIESYAVTGTGGKNTTYSMPGFQAYVMYPDKETVNHAKNLIKLNNK